MGKYEEALERAKQGLPIDEVFPELKESEDERIRTRLIALVEAFGQGEYKDEMLAYLERQKEQKPAEWSEEDERITAKLLSYFNEFDESTSFGSREVIEIRHWLKFLRPQPHWKPSEEQMRCLLDCVSKAKEIHNASVGGYDAYRILVSLYNDLTKL